MQNYVPKPKNITSGVIAVMTCKSLLFQRNELQGSMGHLAQEGHG